MSNRGKTVSDDPAAFLSRVLLAGANHIYDIDFSTSDLRKHRDAARALAMKAAQEKANDLAARADTGQMSQNVVQNIGSGSDGIGTDGTVALGKISVTASVSVSYRLQP